MGRKIARVTLKALTHLSQTSAAMQDPMNGIINWEIVDVVRDVHDRTHGTVTLILESEDWPLTPEGQEPERI